MQKFQKNNQIILDFDSLDESQYKAVISNASNILLRAAAGAGKTKTLINAIAAYRYEYVNDHICAITYTRAARAEMEARLQEMGIYDVDVTTIHVWSRNLLEDFAIKYGFKVSILQENAIKDILRDLAKEYIRFHPRIRSINIEILYSYIMGNKQMDVSDSYKKTLDALERRYIAYKRDNYLYDFTDYPLYLYDIMNLYHEEINNIDALFVDEYQDVDTTQFLLFQKVNAKKKFMVGDKWQSIFAFRGADGEVFDKTLKDENFSLLKLRYNYRSHQEIIDFATTVYQELLPRIQAGEDGYITEVGHSKPSGITCERGAGGEVTVVTPYGEAWQVKDKKVNLNVDFTEAFNDIIMTKPMILCRTNKQVKEINQLGYFEASTVHQAKGLEYQNVIVIDHTITDIEGLNIAYVALTRAKDRVFVINWPQFTLLFGAYQRGE